ncbi:MAG: proline--tRNA ligase, partial [Alphaproteobacteria bacterium]|nr:proline--tRNA ligase [Alphaproteobacteria bacterium]
VPEADYETDLTPIIESYTSSYARSDEMHDAEQFESEVPTEYRVIARGIEVGHIFYFGQKYSEPMKCVVADNTGKDIAVHCGSYGVGISRLVGGLIEASHDDAGIVWAWAVAPFHVGLINLKVGDIATDDVCETLYAKLTAAGIETLYDDRDDRAGTKFSDMDLIGLPFQIVVGPRGLAENTIEIKNRATGEKQSLSPDEAFNYLEAYSESV